MNSLNILTLNAGLLEIDFPFLRSITLVKNKTPRIHAIIDVLRKSAYDVVMLQEIGGSYLKKIIHELRDYFPYHATHRAFKLFSHNLLIISKLPLEKINFVPFKKQTHFESWGIQKGLLCVQVTHNNQPYHFINTHLVASGTKPGDSSPKTLRVRSEQIKQMKHYINTHYNTNDVVIVGGDFNAGPLSCKENYDVIVDELYDCMQHIDESDRITWTTKNPLVRKSTKHDPDKQIDGFYMRHHHYEQFRNRMNIARRFTDAVEISYKKKTDTVMVSDHYGVDLILNTDHQEK